MNEELRKYIHTHLKELIIDLISWDDTGLLSTDSKVRYVAENLTSKWSKAVNLRIASDYIKQESMRKIIELL